MEIHDVYIMSRLKRIMSLENQVDGFNNFNVEKECLYQRGNGAGWLPRSFGVGMMTLGMAL